ncbi:MAG: DUF5655 domain-containing protein [Eubacteriales bacterium]|nr:DUF5655 domain-containing protein [Eubacteriales bacterium]
MNVLDDDTLLFFSGHPNALGPYQALETWLYEAFPHVEKRVMKTQISFYNRHLFACVSFTRVKRKAELPEGWLTLTLGFPTPLDSPRVAVRTEAYPGRWTHHFVLSSIEELDEEMTSWIRASYDFADSKRRPAR